MLDVVLEVGRTKAFATAVDWPGWSRSGRTGEAALERLLAYAPRYAVVARLAGIPFAVTGPAGSARVVEEVAGNATTGFGAPGVVADVDRLPLDASEALRRAALLSAAWQLLDDVAAAAPAQLRKGPRGGGRDRDEVVRHVLAAEAAYARKAGVRLREPDPADRAAVESGRAQLLAVLSQPSDGAPLGGPKGWPARYAVARAAWHVVDHAWEIQDRSEPTG